MASFYSRRMRGGVAAMNLLVTLLIILVAIVVVVAILNFVRSGGRRV
jgi:uncharacterized membrane protein